MSTAQSGAPKAPASRISLDIYLPKDVLTHPGFYLGKDLFVGRRWRQLESDFGKRHSVIDVVVVILLSAKKRISGFLADVAVVVVVGELGEVDEDRLLASRLAAADWPRLSHIVLVADIYHLRSYPRKASRLAA